MEIKETKLAQIKDLVSFSSQFFIPTRKDGIFDALKFCQKFENEGVLKIFVSQINNENIGYISIRLHPESKSFDIGPIFIIPEFSNNGYGKKQVEFILNFAKEVGSSIVQFLNKIFPK